MKAPFTALGAMKGAFMYSVRSYALTVRVSSRVARWVGFASS